MTGRIYINGMGRSGTTWVMKVFDHHPRTFSIFEPDVLGKPSSHDEAEIRHFVEAYFDCRRLRSMRRRPILRKAYRGALAHEVRKGLIFGLTVVARMLPYDIKRHIHVPDLANTSSATKIVKTVSAQWLIGSVARAYPDMRILYVIRHPCGYVASQRNGLVNGRMRRPVALPTHLLEQLDHVRPPTPIDEAALSDIEVMAYRWAALNDVAMAAAETAGNLRILCYEDLCQDPLQAFRSVLEWADLEWHEDCENFLARSLRSERDGDHYHAVVRNPMIAAERWKTSLTAEEQRQILDIAGRSRAMAFYAD